MSKEDIRETVINVGLVLIAFIVAGTLAALASLLLVAFMTTGKTDTPSLVVGWLGGIGLAMGTPLLTHRMMLKVVQFVEENDRPWLRAVALTAKWVNPTAEPTGD
ncbi:hypothetical protein [Haladaptatus sp. CMAA 1911]|uniref:hypothetical protein n=1 Tax=unclassified Haladaptatus TaxID=2622732 RepID=UPI0037545AC7